MQTDIIEATASVSKFGLTESAASRIAAMLENESDGSFFRVAVLGGGRVARRAARAEAGQRRAHGDADRRERRDHRQQQQVGGECLSSWLTRG